MAGLGAQVLCFDSGRAAKRAETMRLFYINQAQVEALLKNKAKKKRARLGVPYQTRYSNLYYHKSRFFH